MQDMSANRPKVTEEDVAEVVARWTGIPVKRIHESLFKFFKYVF